MRYRAWAYIIGAGLALSPVHNLWLTRLATNSRGEVLFFVPAFGYIVLIMGTLLFLVEHWQAVKQVGLGDKCVWVPALVIVSAIGLSGITAPTLGSKMAPLLMGLTLFALYLAARMVGKELFWPVAAGALVAGLGVVVYAALNPGVKGGGYVFGTNYDIATGYILLGVALFVHRWQWLLVTFGLLAIVLSGSPEAVLPIVVVAVALVVRHDWGRRLAYAVAALGLVVAVVFLSDSYRDVHAYSGQIAQGAPTVQVQTEELTVATDPIRWRLIVIERAKQNLTPFGDGYNITKFSVDTVHNVPLIIVQQLGFPGVVAGLAWLWLVGWGIVRTRWRYVWLLVAALSVWDHFIWTQMAPYWWAILGVSTAGHVDSDLIFRKAAA